MHKLRTFLLVAALLAVANGAYAFCFEEAGQEYGINPQILRAIAKVESNFNPAAVNKNSNGTYDVGLMQINSIWAQTIGKKRWEQLGDACSNTKTGAWILSMCIAKYGYNWKAIGCYNSQTPGKSERYARMVFKQLQRVKPLEQEAAYSPLKDRVEDLVKQRVGNWVDEAAQGKQAEFTVKVPAKAVAKMEKEKAQETPQEPPTLNGSPLQFSLPEPSASTGESAQVEVSSNPALGVMP